MGNGTERHTIIKYLNRIEAGDSIIYTREVQTDFYNVALNVLEYLNFSVQIDEEIILSNPWFD